MGKPNTGFNKCNGEARGPHLLLTLLLLLGGGILLSIIGKALLLAPPPDAPPASRPAPNPCESLLPPGLFLPPPTGANAAPLWLHYRLIFDDKQIGHLCRAIEDHGEQLVLRQEMLINNLTISGHRRTMKTSLQALMSRPPADRAPGPWLVNRVEQLHSVVLGEDPGDGSPGSAPPMMFSASPDLEEEGNYAFQAGPLPRGGRDLPPPLLPDGGGKQGPPSPGLEGVEPDAPPYLPDVGGMALLLLKNPDSLPPQGLVFHSVEPLSQNVARGRIMKDTHVLPPAEIPGHVEPTGSAGPSSSPGRYLYRVTMESGYSALVIIGDEGQILEEQLPMGIVAKLMSPTPGAPMTEPREQAPPDMVAQTQIPLQVSPAADKALSSTPLVGNSANQRALFRFTMAPAHSHDGLTGDQSHPWHGLHLFNHRQTREPGDHQPSPPTSKGPPRSGTNTIEVWVNSAPQAPQTLADTGQGEANPRLLAPEPGVESNHPHLQQAATQAAGGDGTSREKAERLTRWVHQNIKQTPVVGFPSAKDTLTGGRGDCNDLAALLTALLRTSGIPAQRVYGLKVVRGDGTSRTLSYNLQHHAWVRVWLPHSSHPVEVDPAFNQFPADSLRVRLMEHSPGHAGPIMAFTSALQEVELVEFLRE